ncbi:Cro/Cl family transcriptional regulator [Pseudidiomarina atlantica]|jgi:transcriptional regulator with XRE-family HTH domain|uniref:Cro/Cl family transcriptional regulator n=1 Tax=Pseudidiomarina atlantica TaxID=1517416 RepID=A0A094ITN8_9GAMM|nr:helix-turn-helix transcriptional regulator [Pseudidiomarina atlantica]KFZ29194.1 Cro/Cl family transcriptional regulator [Pseudidiomarina atlantica]
MKVQVADAKAIGEWARRVRKAQQLDQTTAGAFANCGITFVSQFENGKPTVHLEKALQMLDALGIQVYLDIPDEISSHDD